MKYVRHIGIILGITLAGEFLNQILPLPVPAGVYGLFLMLAALMSGVVKMESVEGTGNFLMDTMSMMFVPATVGILECADELKAVLIPFLIIIAVSTVVVMIVTGKVAQFMMESAEKKKEKGSNEYINSFPGKFPVLGTYLKYSSLSVCLLAETEDKACLFKSNPGICYRDHCIFTGSRN